MVFPEYVYYKLGNMRKIQAFVVYPRDESNLMIVQSDKSIGQFNVNTYRGKLNTKGQYFPFLSIAPSYTFPEEFVKECLRVEKETKQKQ